MEILSVRSQSFLKYGKVHEGLDTSSFIDVLDSQTPKLQNGVIYYPSVPALEATALYPLLRDNVFGGMPIQVGCCNGNNRRLNCLEYHKASELNIPNGDCILLVALESDMRDNAIQSDLVEAFLVPSGTVVELYGTTLHYAPCSVDAKAIFQVAIVLPRDTNTAKPAIDIHTAEDVLLFARNKWLVAHPASKEASEGAFVGILGENIDLDI